MIWKQNDLMKEADPKIDDNGNGKEVRRLIEK
jgi:hypothetical protein